MEAYKSPEQIAFEARVSDAAAKIALYLPEQLELIDRIAADLFSNGHPDAYSPADDLRWDQLADVPPFTRGSNTYPSKLQWRIKVARIMDVLNDWMCNQAKRTKLAIVN